MKKKHGHYVDICGLTFGKWKVIERTSKKKVVYYRCICECGTEREVLSVSLRNGKSKSCGLCGLVWKDKSSESIRKIYHSEYISWIGMKQRCNYKKHSEYHRYGGRGISYDPRWESFNEFINDMGKRPKNYSLDRIDNNKNYSKENCKWSSVSDQMSNTSRNVFVEFSGESMTLKELSRKLNINYDLLHKWHRTKGLSVIDAIKKASK